MNVTIDGFMAGPDCELNWHFQRWTLDMAEHLGDQLSKADTILLGRITYNAMARYWPAIAASVSIAREDIAFAEMMNSHTKIVFSKTLKQSDVTAKGWSNSKLAKKNISDEIVHLKKSHHKPGKDLIVFGSGQLVSSLMQSDLIDEYQLWIHPVVLGKGKPLFKPASLRENGMLKMKLVKTKIFSSGVILLSYKVQKNVGELAPG